MARPPRRRPRSADAILATGQTLQRAARLHRLEAAAMDSAPDRARIWWPSACRPTPPPRCVRPASPCGRNARRRAAARPSGPPEAAALARPRAAPASRTAPIAAAALARLPDPRSEDLAPPARGAGPPSGDPVFGRGILEPAPSGEERRAAAR
jgi:hypothetical protein